jgi:hypothetical protein
MKIKSLESLKPSLKISVITVQNKNCSTQVKTSSYFGVSMPTNVISLLTIGLCLITACGQHQIKESAYCIDDKCIANMHPQQEKLNYKDSISPSLLNMHIKFIGMNLKKFQNLPLNYDQASYNAHFAILNNIEVRIEDFPKDFSEIPNGKGEEVKDLLLEVYYIFRDYCAALFKFAYLTDDSHEHAYHLYEKYDTLIKELNE